MLHRNLAFNHPTSNPVAPAFFDKGASVRKSTVKKRIRRPLKIVGTDHIEDFYSTDHLDLEFLDQESFWMDPDNY
ncbi:MAG: hypothetical protein HOI80_05230 [Alphaproteobacteria bacterium]|jgi:hypothetical protein|nr:hypothetical protein [Alphaproteobacteria bacterium]MBT5390523.1 hypothetical protein [Alphaproteobacteria bacterium]MBT5540357.1 hypothetical protein [Alphaproteobacteria bacterium]MBT5654880.1 hypothetical protein [Alphaproteobacteria bacterium]